MQRKVATTWSSNKVHPTTPWGLGCGWWRWVGFLRLVANIKKRKRPKWFATGDSFMTILRPDWTTAVSEREIGPKVITLGLIFHSERTDGNGTKIRHTDLHGKSGAAKVNIKVLKTYLRTLPSIILVLIVVSLFVFSHSVNIVLINRLV